MLFYFLIIQKRKLKIYFMFSGGESKKSHRYIDQQAEEFGGPYREGT
jgi:hypothetical protein